MASVGEPRPYSGKRLHHHTGGISGFACHMARLTDESLTTIVLSNLYLFPFDRVTRGLLRVAMGLPKIVAQGEPASPQVVGSCAGRFINQDGGVVTVGSNWRWLASDEARFCDPHDPEVEFCFSDSRDGYYHQLTYHSPLWPPARYVRG